MRKDIGALGGPLLVLAVAAWWGGGQTGASGAAPTAGTRRPPRMALFRGARPFTLASALRRPEHPIGPVGLRKLVMIAPGAGAGGLPLPLTPASRADRYATLPRSLFAARALDSGLEPSSDSAGPSDDGDGESAVAADLEGPPLTGAAASPAALDGLMIPVVGVSGRQLHDSFRSPRTGHVHHAIDIIARRGTPVVAAIDGTIERLRWDHGGGRTIRLLDDTRRYILYYAHLSGYAAGLEQGDTVRRGQVLGYVGHTGHVIGSSHLHFRIGRVHDPDKWWNDRPLDPYPLLKHAEPADSVIRP